MILLSIIQKGAAFIHSRKTKKKFLLELVFKAGTVGKVDKRDTNSFLKRCEYISTPGIGKGVEAWYLLSCACI